MAVITWPAVTSSQPSRFVLLLLLHAVSLCVVSHCISLRNKRILWDSSNERNFERSVFAEVVILTNCLVLGTQSKISGSLCCTVTWSNLAADRRISDRLQTPTESCWLTFKCFVLYYCLFCYHSMCMARYFSDDLLIYWPQHSVKQSPYSDTFWCCSHSLSTTRRTR